MVSSYILGHYLMLIECLLTNLHTPQLTNGCPDLTWKNTIVKDVIKPEMHQTLVSACTYLVGLIPHQLNTHSRRRYCGDLIFSVAERSLQTTQHHASINMPSLEND